MSSIGEHADREVLDRVRAGLKHAAAAPVGLERYATILTQQRGDDSA